MRKILLLVFAIYSLVANAQTVNNPKVLARSNKDVKIDKIEVNEDNTIVYLKLFNGVENGFVLPSSTYIVSANGGEPIKITKAKGIDLDVVYRNKNKRSLKLIFPKIDDGVNKFNLRSGSDKCNWNFYEIDLNRNLGTDKYINPSRKEVIYKDGKKVRLIENPHFEASSTSNLKLKCIEMTEEETIFSFSYTNNNGWFSVPKGTCIQEGDGGELLFVKYAEGTNVSERVTIRGTVHYKLFFPPVSADAQKLHFKEVNKGGSWYIFDIDVSMD